MDDSSNSIWTELDITETSYEKKILFLIEI